MITSAIKNQINRIWGAFSSGDISIYGQESSYTTWRLAKMNLAIRGIDAQIALGTY